MHRSSTLMAGVCLMASPCVWAQTNSTVPDPTDATYPVVITPTRLSQSLADVPASVSIITAEMIRRYGILSVPEALRFVPGMAVTRATGPDYQISYHGTRALSPRRMNVLIDGISVYRPAFSEVIWSQLPVAMDDIDRIEVTRGPNSAAYGPNSMLAIINIITKHPKDAGRAYASFSAGSPRTANAAGRATIGVGSTTVRLSAERSVDSGFSALKQDPLAHDSLYVNKLALLSQTELSPVSSLALQASTAQGTAQVPFADNFQISYPDQRFSDVYVGAAWTHQVSPTHEVLLRLNHARQRVEQSWRTCLPTLAFVPEMFALWQANSSYANAIVAGRTPSGGTTTDDALAMAALAAIRRLGSRVWAPTCGSTNDDALQSRTDVELQDTFVFSERLRVVGGIGARQQHGESETFLGGTQSSRIQWLFGNIEVRPRPWITFNIGGYAERNTLSPSSFSPRAAANVRLTPTQTVRVVLSKGSRGPDIQEQRANWTYTFTQLDPSLNGATVGRLYQSRIGRGDLVSERITSKEIGYLLNQPRYGLLFDVRLFDDELNSLITERTNLAGPAATNNGSVQLRGVEVQASVRWTPEWSVFVNYAYLENRNSSSVLERTQYSRHSGSMGLSHDVGLGWSVAAAYAGASGDGFQQSRYGRADLTLSKSGDIGGARWTTAFGLRRLDEPITIYSIGSAEPLSSAYPGRTQGFVQISVRIP